MRTFFEAGDRAAILARLAALPPDSPRRWGTMDAPRMVAHLTDQMRHCLGDAPCAPVHGPLRNRLMRNLSIYWLPWPKGRIQGPPDAFRTPPGDWEADRQRLAALVHRFAERGPDGDWPDHGLFGPMRGRDWGALCFRHFDHHLRQFGV